MRLALTLMLTLLTSSAMAADPIPLPGVDLVSDGCSPCRTGDHARVSLRVFRPGVSTSEAEVRAAIITPTGAIISLPISGTIVTLPAGLSAVTILDIVVANPPGVYLIEGALLDTKTGATLDRRTLGVIVN